MGELNAEYTTVTEARLRIKNRELEAENAELKEANGILTEALDESLAFIDKVGTSVPLGGSLGRKREAQAIVGKYKALSKGKLNE